MSKIVNRNGRPVVVRKIEDLRYTDFAPEAAVYIARRQAVQEIKRTWARKAAPLIARIVAAERQERLPSPGLSEQALRRGQAEHDRQAGRRLP
jgi:hypothetical protein